LEHKTQKGDEQQKKKDPLEKIRKGWKAKAGPGKRGGEGKQTLKEVHTTEERG